MIELLVVLVIIGLLASITLPRFWGARGRAYQTQMQNDLRNLASAEEAYFESHMMYTASQPTLDFNHTSGVTIYITEATGAGWSASASHTAIPTLCGMYYGAASAPAGIPIPGEGIVACN